MITVNLGIELGGYSTVYTAELAQWPAWPINAKFLLKVAPFALELKVVLEVEGCRMEFTVVKL